MAAAPREPSAAPSAAVKAPELTRSSPASRRDDDTQPAALHAIGLVEAELGQFDEAATTLGQALAARQALARGDPSNAGYRAEVASTMVAQGRLAWRAGRLAAAIGTWRGVQQLLEADIAKHPDEPVLAQQLVQADIVVAQSYAEQALWEEASQAMARAVRHGLTDHTAAVVRMSLLAVTRDRKALLKLASELIERYGKTSDVMVASGLARWCALVPGVIPDAERLVAFAQQAPVFGHTDSLRMFNLSLAEYRAGRFEDAIRDARKSLASDSGGESRTAGRVQ